MPDWFRSTVWAQGPPDETVAPPALGRRRAVTAAVVVVGAFVLGVSLRIDPGSLWFYPSTLALALVWAVGALASGPLHLGRVAVRGELKRPLLSPIVIGLALAGVFALGALLVRGIPLLEHQISSVLAHAKHGSMPLVVLITVVNGVAEELFFRGALYVSVPRRRILFTTAAYTLTTLAAGNVMLTFAAAVLGIVVGLERRASGGILAPMLTHVTWALAMLFVLPLLVG